MLQLGFSQFLEFGFVKLLTNYEVRLLDYELKNKYLIDKNV